MQSDTEADENFHESSEVASQIAAQEDDQEEIKEGTEAEDSQQPDNQSDAEDSSVHIYFDFSSETSSQSDLSRAITTEGESVIADPQDKLLDFTKSGDLDAALELINEQKESFKELKSDKSKRTAAHYAARWSHGESTLQLLVETCGSQCLIIPDKDGITPMHLSAIMHSKMQFDMNRSSVKELPENVENLQKIKDSDGDTILHAAVQNETYRDEILKAVALEEPESLMWQNNRKETVFHAAMQCVESATAQMLLTSVSPECLNVKDDEGNTWVHSAAQNVDGSVLLLAVSEMGAECLGWSNNTKQTVLHLAMSQWNSIGQILDKVEDKLLVTRLDVDGKTFLHYLFQYSHCPEADNILQSFLKLLDAGVNVKAEDNLGRNCLQTSTLMSSELAFVLKEALDSEDSVKKQFQDLLENSSGVHAVHYFAAIQDLDALIEPLAALSELEVSELLHKRVTTGLRKGASCLHFACESGKHSNISYLLQNGLQLSEETESGLNCVDFAYEKGMFDELQCAVIETQDFKDDRIGLWRLLDPTKRALRLPEKSMARQLLGSISEDSVTADVHRDKILTNPNRAVATQEKKEEHSKKQVEVSERDCDRTDLNILFKAVELDSPKILRSATILDLFTTETERLFPQFLKKQLDELEEDTRDFPKREYFSIMEFTDTASELSIIDAAAFFDKVELLPDLILTRQFALIPACISLLIQLKIKITEKEGRHEQLKMLYDKVVSISINALDGLYINADETEKKLLFSYIRGKIKDEYTSKSNPGPRFPCRRTLRESVSFCSVMDMIKEAGEIDLFATDCLHQLVEDEWQSADQNQNLTRIR